MCENCKKRSEIMNKAKQALEYVKSHLINYNRITSNDVKTELYDEDIEAIKALDKAIEALSWISDYLPNEHRKEYDILYSGKARVAYWDNNETMFCWDKLLLRPVKRNGKYYLVEYWKERPTPPEGE